ncbi:putative vacuolar import/degradation Vid27 [Helianthus annuus]|nr:putative vacuolar import/degradation Vid27 [Helianthus annuus]KAJ0743216.1 putative vacuolar import/degradation Vid27 [Helianthus annuus]
MWAFELEKLLLVIQHEFLRRMENGISAPRLLKLNPLESHRAQVFNKFRGDQFLWVTEDGKQEHLVATLGKFNVIWNFL